jgi:hypothetical protein
VSQVVPVEDVGGTAVFEQHLFGQPFLSDITVGLLRGRIGRIIDELDVGSDEDSEDEEDEVEMRLKQAICPRIIDSYIYQCFISRFMKASWL